ncbi:hypothetical protein [Alcanivorax sp. 1008]|uniref:hypothetical protein n=1 Tax=Alcanivorax sp. 1008 TaxID=2816853 RepID=UPI001D5FA8FA|nr:hypothetical protein [Alcanivorax sp. 1008]MCC1496683.1 hypothetical protein [Alcanivorax sp. 1008]
MKRLWQGLLVWLVLVCSVVAGELDQDLAQFRKDVLDINRRLLLLEEELLFPADTQLAVFVSLDVGKYFSPDSITLKLDGKTIDGHLYTEREVQALKTGAIQKLHVTNIRNGSHELTAFVSGSGPGNREYRRAVTLQFEKGNGRQFVQLRMEDDAAAQQPVFVLHSWQ